jgi:hypothetical protein
MIGGPILGGAARLKFDSSLNIVFDGNSLFNGQGGQDVPRIAVKTYPISAATHPVTESYDSPVTASGTNWQTRTSDRGVPVRKTAISGQTWRQMNGIGSSGETAADVDGAFVSGKTNVLIAWEGTNSMWPSLGNRTAAQAVQDATDYIAARQAAVAASYPGQKWIVLIGTCLPRESPTSEAATDSFNRNSVEPYNTTLRNTYRSMGARGLFDVQQAGSAFKLPDYSYASFEASAANTGYWAATTAEGGQDSVNGRTHLSTNGYAYLVTNIIMPALMRLPRR